MITEAAIDQCIEYWQGQTGLSDEILNGLASHCDSSTYEDFDLSLEESITEYFELHEAIEKESPNA